MTEALESGKETLIKRVQCGAVSPIDLPGMQCELGKGHAGKHAQFTWDGLLWWGDDAKTVNQAQCQHHGRRKGRVIG